MSYWQTFSGYGQISKPGYLRYQQVFKKVAVIGTFCVLVSALQMLPPVTKVIALVVVISVACRPAQAESIVLIAVMPVTNQFRLTALRSIVAALATDAGISSTPWMFDMMLLPDGTPAMGVALSDTSRFESRTFALRCPNRMPYDPFPPCAEQLRPICESETFRAAKPLTFW